MVVDIGGAEGLVAWAVDAVVRRSIANVLTVDIVWKRIKMHSCFLRRACTKVAHSCTRFPCYLGMEIYQCKDPMDNNKDCRVGQLTRTKVTMLFVL